jgi:hypothetical protein
MGGVGRLVSSPGSDHEIGIRFLIGKSGIGSDRCSHGMGA